MKILYLLQAAFVLLSAVAQAVLEDNVQHVIQRQLVNDDAQVFTVLFTHVAPPSLSSPVHDETDTIASAVTTAVTPDLSDDLSSYFVDNVAHLRALNARSTSIVSSLVVQMASQSTAASLRTESHDSKSAIVQSQSMAQENFMKTMSEMHQAMSKLTRDYDKSLSQAKLRQPAARTASTHDQKLMETLQMALKTKQLVAKAQQQSMEAHRKLIEAQQLISEGYQQSSKARELLSAAQKYAARGDWSVSEARRIRDEVTASANCLHREASTSRPELSLITILAVVCLFGFVCGPLAENFYQLLPQQIKVFVAAVLQSVPTNVNDQEGQHSVAIESTSAAALQRENAPPSMVSTVLQVTENAKEEMKQANGAKPQAEDALHLAKDSLSHASNDSDDSSGYELLSK